MNSAGYLKHLIEAKVANLRLQNSGILIRSIEKLEQIKLSEVRRDVKKNK